MFLVLKRERVHILFLCQTFLFLNDIRIGLTTISDIDIKGFISLCPKAPEVFPRERETEVEPEGV